MCIRIRRSLTIGVCLVFLAGFPIGSQGSLVTWEFEGVVDHISDPNNLLNGAVSIGSPFTGRFTYDASTPDSDPHPSRGIYDNAIISLEGAVGLLPFLGPTDGRDDFLEIQNGYSNPNGESFGVRFGIALGSFQVDFLLFLANGNGILIDNDALPSGTLPLDQFPFTKIAAVDISEQLHLNVEGPITGLVPEPPMIAYTIAIIALVTWRRARNEVSRAGKLPAADSSAVRAGGSPALLHWRGETCSRGGISHQR